jgi:HSP20 family protein
MVEALHGLIDQLSEAARKARPEDDDTAPAAARAEAAADGRTFAKSVELGSKGARMVFGYTLRMGLDGVSAEPFGDVPDTAATPAAQAARQPIVEVFEEPGSIVVVAELPGADPASLVCRVEGRTLLIEAGGARRYRKQVALPAAVRPGEPRQNFQNGILEVRLARADAA